MLPTWTRSQTSWIWLETKLVELGMIGEERDYKVLAILLLLGVYLTYPQISFGVFLYHCDCSVLTGVFGQLAVLDKGPMFTVFSRKDGKPYQHSVKALQIIWNHFPQ